MHSIIKMTSPNDKAMNTSGKTNVETLIKEEKTEHPERNSKVFHSRPCTVWHEG